MCDCMPYMPKPAYWGKTNDVQTNVGHDNTEQALITNLGCIFL